MNESLIRGSIFAVGVAIGAVGAGVYFNKKYQKLADEEIASVKKTYSNKKHKEKKELEDGEDNFGDDCSSREAYIHTIEGGVPYKQFYGRNKEDDAYLDDVRSVFPVEEEPFEIGSDDYTDDTEYFKQTLNYYTEDGVLIYEESEEIAEDEKTVGIQNLDDFCRVPDQTAYFRDPKLKIDYEVIKVYGSYHELIAGNV